MPHFIHTKSGSDMARAKKAPDFEQALEQLEELVEAMESGDLSLEESLKSFEQGIKLTRDCQTALSQAEQKVQLLQEQNGQLTSIDFEDAEDA
jgi:exodeoxyribonuclease VII small subunit